MRKPALPGVGVERPFFRIQDQLISTMFALDPKILLSEVGITEGNLTKLTLEQ
jgi:hypothetical protein